MKTQSTIIFLSFLMFSVIACVSPTKLIEKKQYGSALRVSKQRLSNGKVKLEHLIAFETAFQELNDKDLKLIDQLKSKGDRSYWPEIYKHYQSIDKRQQNIQPILKRLKEKGASTTLSLRDIDAVMTEARYESALYFYDEAQDFVAAARAGDRMAARAAYGNFNRSINYQLIDESIPDLLTEMHELGITRVVLTPELSNESFDLDQRLFDDMLGRIAFPIMTKWQHTYLNETYNGDVHYQAYIHIQDYYVSPNRESRSSCTSQIEVEDGYLIEKKWSKKDSAYIEVKTPKFKTVSVNVDTYEQSKDGGLTLFYTIEKSQDQSIWQEHQLQGSTSWSNTFSTVNGDVRALEGGCTDYGGSNNFFPSDSKMLSRAACNLSFSLNHRIKEEIE